MSKNYIKIKGTVNNKNVAIYSGYVSKIKGDVLLIYSQQRSNLVSLRYA